MNPTKSIYPLNFLILKTFLIPNSDVHPDSGFKYGLLYKLIGPISPLKYSSVIVGNLKPCPNEERIFHPLDNS